MKLGSLVKPIAFSLALAGSAISAHAAALTNADFETGTLAGWTALGDAQVVNSFVGISAPQGSFMAQISSGAASIGGVTSLLLTGFDPLTTPMVAWVNFVSTEFPNDPTFNDNMSVSVNGIQTFKLDTFNLDVNLPTNDPENISQSGWHQVLIAAGTTSLLFQVNNVGDNDPAFPSYALIDIVPVPEPSSYALLLAGLGLLGFMTKRRMSV